LRYFVGAVAAIPPARREANWHLAANLSKKGHVGALVRR